MFLDYDSNNYIIAEFDIKNDNQNKIIVDGKNVKNATDLKKDDEISIFFNDGIVFAQVINIIKKG